MGFFDILTDVIAAPITMPLKALDLSIKAVETLPDIAEEVLNKIEKAADKIGE